MAPAAYTAWPCKFNRFTKKGLFGRDNPKVTLSRHELLREVWGHDADTLTRTVDVHVAGLRQKLERIPQKPELIVTISGLGYKFLG